MKSVYKFFIIALILGIIAWIVYFVISKNTTIDTPNEDVLVSTTTEIIDTENTEGGDTTTTTTDQITEKTLENEDYESEKVKILFNEIKKISDVPVKFYWYYAENNRIFYITEGGEIKKVIDEKNEQISINPLKNVTVARSNRGGSLILLKFNTDSGVVWGIFSSMDEQIIPLNFPITDAVWAFNNQDIIATISKNGKTSVVSFSSLKTYSESVVLIPEIKLLDVDMIEKSQDELLFVEKPGGDYTTSIWQYNKKTKLFSVIRTGLLDFSLHPTASNYFFSSKNDGFIIGNNNFVHLIPTIHETLPEKCSSISTIAFCFIPQKPIQLFDWITNSVFSNDSLYVYDLYSQEESGVDLEKITKTAIDAKNITPTYSSLYFINKYDNFIYALN